MELTEGALEKSDWWVKAWKEKKLVSKLYYMLRDDIESKWIIDRNQSFIWSTRQSVLRLLSRVSASAFLDPRFIL